MAFSTGKLENSGIFFPLKSFRTHFLTLIHKLKIILSFHQFIS